MNTTTVGFVHKIRQAKHVTIYLTSLRCGTIRRIRTMQAHISRILPARITANNTKRLALWSSFCLQRNVEIQSALPCPFSIIWDRPYDYANYALELFLNAFKFLHWVCYNYASLPGSYPTPQYFHFLLLWMDLPNFPFKINIYNLKLLVRLEVVSWNSVKCAVLIAERCSCDDWCFSNTRRHLN